MRQLNDSIPEQIHAIAKAHADREAAEFASIYECETCPACLGYAGEAGKCPNELHRDAAYHEKIASLLPEKAVAHERIASRLRQLAACGPLTPEEFGIQLD